MYFFLTPFKGTDPRNRVGRSTVSPMSSGVPWKKFATTKSVDGTLAAESAVDRPAIAGFGSHATPAWHATGQWVSRLLDGCDIAGFSGSLQPPLTRCAYLVDQGKENRQILELPSLVVEDTGPAGASGARGHSEALACRNRASTCQRAPREEGEGRCLNSRIFCGGGCWCSAGLEGLTSRYCARVVVSRGPLQRSLEGSH